MCPEPFILLWIKPENGWLSCAHLSTDCGRDLTKQLFTNGLEQSHVSLKLPELQHVAGFPGTWSPLEQRWLVDS